MLLNCMPCGMISIWNYSKLLEILPTNLKYKVGHVGVNELPMGFLGIMDQFVPIYYGIRHIIVHKYYWAICCMQSIRIPSI